MTRTVIEGRKRDLNNPNERIVEPRTNTQPLKQRIIITNTAISRLSLRYILSRLGIRKL